MTTVSMKKSTGDSTLHLPPVEGRFPLGVLPEFQRNPLKLYLRTMHQYRDVVRLRFGPRYSYTLFQPDFVKHLLVDNNKNYRRAKVGNGLLKSITGENLLTSDGDFWRRQRRLIQPAFHRQRIFGFGQLMTASAAAMLADWDQIPAGQIVRVDQAMMRVTLQIVGQSLFSVDLSTGSSALGHAITVGSEYFTYRLGHLFALPLWVPTPRNLAYKRSQAAVVNQVPDMISARRRLIAAQGDAASSGRQYDMLDLLLDARYEDTGEPMDDQQLAREIRIMISAGHETTANTLTWTLYLLSQNPGAEAKLQAEVDTVLSGRTPTVDDLPQLPYTHQVIQEAMRLYPAAWVVARQSIGEDQLGQYHVPADQGMVMPIYAIHRHPDFWPDAEVFDPERFTPEAAAQQHRFAYFPFGGGPRMCIGNLFALTEAQLILAMIAQRYQPRLQPGYKVEPEALITLRVKGGLPMTLARR